MNVSYGKNALDVSRGLKVVSNRIPFSDHTNNFLKPVESKCDVKGMKANRKNNKQYGENVAAYRKISRKRNNCVLEESVDSSTHIPVPELSKCCTAISERIEVPNAVNSSKVMSEKIKVPEVFKSCQVNLGKEKSVRKLNNISHREEKVRSITPLVKRLRKCNERNYFESSLECSMIESSKIEDKNTPALKQKIPIYKQNIEECKENEKDPYKLDIFDLDEDKPKRGKNLNSSRKFNKTMYDLLEKLDKKEKKLVKKKTQTSNHIPKYNDKIKNVLKKVMNKVNDRKKVVTKVVQVNGSKTPTASDNLGERNRNVVKDHFVQYGNSNKQAKVPNGEKKLSMPVGPLQEYSIKNVSCTSTVVNKTKEVPTLIESINGNESGSVFLGFNNTNSQLKTPTSHHPNPSINIISDIDLRPVNSPLHSWDNQSDSHSETDCNDRYFGFGGEGDDVVNFPHKIIESPAFFSHRRPNANSTMIGGAQKSPWRLSMPGKRNNYFLLMKNNSLPSFNQDMVLDHSVIEESERNLQSRCEEVERPKSPVQTSILDFVEGSTDHHSNKIQDNMRRTSLFDYEDFIVTKPRRKVLGVLQDNVLGRKQSESTPRKDPPNPIESPDISAVGDIFHGVDTINEESKENRRPSSRPFRIDAGDVRKYKKNNNMPVEKEAELPILEESDEEPNELEEQDTTTQAGDMQLFGDFDSNQKLDMSIKLPKFTYGKKRGRKRLLSITCDESGEPKKKKKDMMTKAELDAYENWAKEFNSMCKEVDEHQLEIE